MGSLIGYALLHFRGRYISKGFGNHTKQDVSSSNALCNYFSSWGGAPGRNYFQNVLIEKQMMQYALLDIDLSIMVHQASNGRHSGYPTTVAGKAQHGSTTPTLGSSTTTHLRTMLGVLGLLFDRRYSACGSFEAT